ncbi:HNH endonuclease [Gordonia sp. PDNC005]|uniref:HNH endonuclease signature motif containing protein n=1 Tax=Gordonia sp. MMO-8 TaxID=3127886 RepID=UPI0019635849|nr:HNH endonuclease [Gordonia sp. PDNC005]
MLKRSTWPGTGKLEPGEGQPEFQPLPTVEWPDTPDHPYPPVNKLGVPYPKVIDPRTGMPIPHPPRPNMERVSPDLRAKGGWRKPFLNEWISRGYPVPEGNPNFDGWEVHHIIPREFGGTNDFNNLIPLPREIHNIYSRWFDQYGN